ncbi:hypothetical protein GCM10011534_14160 [Pseudooceanicola nanhaiensis]|jgi:hypothetical protein|uniref:Uncharacterized protein n=1 Tax=Pseudooceanicola nanhaiensis TaxID=375761 RepID=A0A917SQI0_9RHOB|nr:hypothetical protein [Pseudooceanicola nanhaiensis]GGL93164.1 hypothetical protein GCM10011534_14160 [Pseudooceanicola nanhaiensis]
MLIALFALIALASVVTFDVTDATGAEGAEPSTARPEDPGPTMPARLAALCRRSAPAGDHVVVTDLERTRREGDMLVLEYDRALPVPDLRLEHAPGRSTLFANDRLVLEVRGRGSRLSLSEIGLRGVVPHA